MRKNAQRWESHYQLCLGLFVLAANVELCVGDYDRAYNYLQEVLSMTKTERDKLPAYIALGEGLGVQERHREGLNIGLKALRILIDFPRRFIDCHC